VRGTCASVAFAVSTFAYSKQCIVNIEAHSVKSYKMFMGKKFSGIYTVVASVCFASESQITEPPTDICG
jgi:hypothetical protein